MSVKSINSPNKINTSASFITAAMDEASITLIKPINHIENNITTKLYDWLSQQSNSSNIEKIITFSRNIINSLIKGNIIPSKISDTQTNISNIKEYISKISLHEIKKDSSLINILGFHDSNSLAESVANFIVSELQKSLEESVSLLYNIIKPVKPTSLLTNSANSSSIANSSFIDGVANKAIICSILEMVNFMQTVLDSSSIEATVSSNIARAAQMLNNILAFLGTLQKIYGDADAKKVKDTDNKNDYIDWNIANKKYFEDAAKEQGSEFQVVNTTITDDMVDSEKQRILDMVNAVVKTFAQNKSPLNPTGRIDIGKLIEESKLSPPVSEQERPILEGIIGKSLDSTTIVLTQYYDEYKKVQNGKETVISEKEYNALIQEWSKNPDIRSGEQVIDLVDISIYIDANKFKSTADNLVGSLDNNKIKSVLNDNYGFSVSAKDIPESLRAFFSQDPHNPGNIIINTYDISHSTFTSKSNITNQALSLLDVVSQIVSGVLATNDSSSIAGSYSDKYTNSNQINNMISALNSYLQQINSTAGNLSSAISALSNALQQISQTGSGMVSTGQQANRSTIGGQ